MGSWPVWKTIEKHVADTLGWERVVRVDFGEKNIDVKPPHWMSFLKLDAKGRKSFMHHTLFGEAKEKYCKEPEDKLILVTRETNKDKKAIKFKNGNELPYLAIIELDFLKELLDETYPLIDLREDK